MFRRGNTPGKESKEEVELPLKSNEQQDSELEIVPVYQLTASSNSLFGLVRLHSSCVWIVVIVCFGALNVGFHIGYSSPAGKALQSVSGITAQQLDLVLSTMNIGCILGSLASSSVANYWGRKKGMVIANLPFLAGIAIALGPAISYHKLIASRLCTRVFLFCFIF
jgi:MFS family permease